MHVVSMMCEEPVTEFLTVDIWSSTLLFFFHLMNSHVIKVFGISVQCDDNASFIVA